MFDPTSRYYVLAESAAEPTEDLRDDGMSHPLEEPRSGELVYERDGRQIVYKARRFLARGERMEPLLVEWTVDQGERLDLVAAKTLGRSDQFWLICDANNAMNPFDLAVPGKRLRVPVPRS